MSSIARPLPSRRFRVALTGDGCPGPIEERIGRRLVRLFALAADAGGQVAVMVPALMIKLDETHATHIGSSGEPATTAVH